jgi:HlyD family secretion protein
MTAPETSATKAENGVLTRPLDRPGATTGEGRDRRLEKKLWTPARLAMLGVGLLLLTLLTWTVLSQSGGRRLAVDAERLTVSTVERGPFQEYIAVTGYVQPIRTIYLDAVLGGQVDERYVREGERVEEGQPLVRLANDQITLQMLSNEAALQEQMNNLRNTRLALDQNELSLRQQLTELEYRVHSLSRETNRNRDLANRGAIASREYEDVRDEYEYFRNRLALTQQSYRQDSLARAMQLRQMDQQMQRLQNNLQLLQTSRDNLVVRAPIAGLLSAFDAEVGEAKAAGARLGQIDDLTGWRLRVPIDEHYIARVTAGQRGTAQVAGEDVELTVTTVYPEVREGRFEVDMAFVDNEPGLRRGQSVRIRLELDQPEEAILLARGGFFTATGGHWVFALASDGEAVRRPIRIGRQNPQHFEVLDGLEPGDRVITSGYDTFGDAARLILR